MTYKIQSMNHSQWPGLATFPKSFRDTLNRGFDNIQINIFKTINNSSFELRNSFSRPALIVHFLTQISEKIFNWTTLRDISRVSVFAHKPDVLFFQMFDHFFRLMWRSLVGPKHVVVVRMFVSNKWYQTLLHALIQIHILVDRESARLEVGFGDSILRYRYS